MRGVRLSRRAGWLALAGLALGCAGLSGQIPARVPAGPSAAFRAGAAKVDLTPIPGISLHGYSAAGAVARGFWTRLFARAIYLEDASGVPLALVLCDLPMIPNGLSDEVARLLHDEHGLHHIGREQLVLAATHTHHGPGNFLTSPLYNTVSPARPGFDPELFDFLSRKIASAVAAASANPTAAFVSAKSGKIDGLVKNRSLEAFVLNGKEARDFVQGADCDLPGADPSRCLDTCEAPADLEAFARLDFKECAADPRISLLEIRDASTSALIAVAAFLATHNTVLRPDLDVYAGDLFGVSALLLERSWQDFQTCLYDPASPPARLPVAALFNGAEGDVSPARGLGERDRVALLDRAVPAISPPPSGRGLALRLAKAVCDLVGQPPTSTETSPAIGFRFDVVPIRGRPFATAWDEPGSYPRSTASFAEAGAAAVGGSEEDGTSALHEMGNSEGRRNFVRGEHGAKLPPFQFEMAGGSFSATGAALRLVQPPLEAPIGVYRVGGTALVSLPGEFTTLMGARIRERVRSALAPPPDRVLLLGLANGHVSYFPTPEEYDAQHYEGATDFFGAAAGPYLECEIARLAGILSGATPTPCSTESPPLPPLTERCWPSPPGPLCSSPPAARSYDYDPGGTRRIFRPRDAVGPWGGRSMIDALFGSSTGSTPEEVASGNLAAAAAVYRVDDGLAAVVQDLTTRYPERNFPATCWHDAIPRLKGVLAGQCDRAVPDVTVVKRVSVMLGAGTVTIDTPVADNQGLDLVTVLTSVGDDRIEWCAIWMAPEDADPAANYAFVVTGIKATPPDFAFRLDTGPRVSRPLLLLRPDPATNPLCEQYPDLWLCPTTCQN